MADRVIYSGEAGTRFTNETGKICYQFFATLVNTCGFCLQYHLKISPGMWPIPLHYGCHCGQQMIKRGQTAPEPFCDYRKLLDEMSPHDQAAAIGASNYRLLKSGLAKWEDIVTPNRVRDFREVVAKKNLSVKQMVDHGVKKYQAEQAYSAVHTAEHEHAERQRRELLQKLTGAGLSQENLVKELSSRLAARVTIAPGPTGPYTEDPAWSGGPLPGTGPSGAAELARLISGYRPKRQRAAMPQKPLSEKPKPEPAAQPERTAEEAAQLVEQMEPTNYKGTPKADGRYISADNFFDRSTLRDADLAAKFDAATKDESIYEAARTRGREQEVSIRSLYVQQPIVRKEVVLENLADRAAMTSTKPGGTLPVVYEIDGKLVLADGTHRLAAMEIAGIQKTRVTVVRIP